MPDLFSLSFETLYVIAGIISGILRASGAKVRTGTTGLLYTLGRTDRSVPRLLRPIANRFVREDGTPLFPRRLLEPGFHFMVPFVQVARMVPTRSRTLDLPAQRVVNHEGYVYVVDANLVYRITDVPKALIKVDDLVKGMEQMLTLGVQEVIRAAATAELQSTAGLDDRLKANLAHRLRPWGVEVERAGFPSLAPSEESLRITQLGESVRERTRTLGILGDAGLSISSGLGAIGTRRVFRTKAVAGRPGALKHRNRLRILARLQLKGWNGAQIKRVLPRRPLTGGGRGPR